MAQGKAFWIFFAFGISTVLLAFLGAGYAFSQGKGVSLGFGLLLLFLGASLAVTLGSLLFIRMKTKQ